MKKQLLFAILATSCAAIVNAVTVTSVTARTPSGDTARLDDVLLRCEVKAGSEYDPAACSRDVHVLKDSGQFDDITVRVDRNHSGGVDVAYVVTRKKRFQAPLNVKGNDYWNVKKITTLSELQDGYAYGEAEIAAAAARVRNEYRKKHFINAKVTPVVEPIPGSDDAVTITFDIVEGERLKNEKFAFEGNDQFEDSELRELVGQFPWWNPMGWFSDEPATVNDFDEACAKIAQRFKDAGFLNATVRLSGEKSVLNGRILYTFVIDKGTQYRVASFSVSGVTKCPADQVLASIKNIKPGDIAGDSALREAARQIEIFCGSGEFALAETHVEVRTTVSAEDKTLMDVKFVVTEGVPVTIRNVVVRGNDWTKDKVIRREITLAPGDPMLEDKAEQSKRRVENLRYFDRVRYYLERTEDGTSTVPGQPELRDLVFQVDEKNTGNFMVGIGASSVDSVYGTVELSESNFDLFNPWRFRGAGQKGRIAAAAGPRIQTYEASVTEPYFLDRYLELMVEVYRRQRWFDEYDAIRSGAAVTLSYPVKFWPTAKALGRLGFRLSAEYVEMDDVESGIWYTSAGRAVSFKEEDEKYGDSWELPLRIFWEDDTRDKFLFPTKGHKTSIYGDLVGGDNEYWRLGFTYKQYWQVWKKHGHVLSFSARGETLDAFSGDVPIYDRLFLGGPRSIRGVEYREVSPWVYRDMGKKGSHEPWGGQTSWLLSAEYTVPIVKFVRVAGFTDLGSVGEDEFDFSTDNFVWSVGVGLRLDIESFPIRLDVATPIDKNSGIDEQVFSFSVGYDF